MQEQQSHQQQGASSKSVMVLNSSERQQQVRVKAEGREARLQVKDWSEAKHKLNIRLRQNIP